MLKFCLKKRNLAVKEVNPGKTMRVYIDIAHPAHAHAFRYFIKEMEGRGHEVLVSARDKDITFCLLREWGIPFADRGRGWSPSFRGGPLPVRLLQSLVSLAGKAGYLLAVIARLLPMVRRFSPHLVISWSSYHAALTGRLLRVPVITFEDTEGVGLLHRVNRALSSLMVTPASFETDLGRKHVRFDGYKELASLHPSRFTPAALPDSPGKPYTVMRFVAWRAWHDRGHSGISEEMKRELVRRLSRHGRVYISSEEPLPRDLQEYRVPAGCGALHTLLAGAALFFGESASMAAEAAVLGVPAIYIDNMGRGYTRDLERMGLLFGYGEGDGQVREAADRAEGLLGDPGMAGEWQRRRTRMMEGKCDLTGWMVELAGHIGGGGAVDTVAEANSHRSPGNPPPGDS